MQDEARAGNRSGAATNARPVLLRVKRRRGDPSSDTVMVEEQPPAKRAKVDAAAEKLGGISLDNSGNDSTGSAYQDGGNDARAQQQRSAGVRFRRVASLSAAELRKPSVTRRILDQIRSYRNRSSSSRVDDVVEARRAEREVRSAAGAHARRRIVAEEEHARRLDAAREARIESTRHGNRSRSGGARRGARLDDVFSFCDADLVEDTLMDEAVEETRRAKQALQDPIACTEKKGPQKALAQRARAYEAEVDRLREHRIFTPAEQECDIAVWEAFARGSFARLWDLIQTERASSSSSASSSTPSIATFRRWQSDSATALMAAAFHGNDEVVDALLLLGAVVAMREQGGRTAVDFARMQGHKVLADRLQQAMEEQMQAQGEVSWNHGSLDEDDEEVSYDLFMVDWTKQGTSDPGGATETIVSPSETGDTSVRRVTVSSDLWAGLVESFHDGAMEVAERSLDAEHRALLQRRKRGLKDPVRRGVGEDEDSNSEGYEGNSYPDEDDVWSTTSSTGNGKFGDGSWEEEEDGDEEEEEGGADQGPDANVARVARGTLSSGDALHHIRGLDYDDEEDEESAVDDDDDDD